MMMIDHCRFDKKEVINYHAAAAAAAATFARSVWLQALRMSI